MPPPSPWPEFDALLLLSFGGPEGPEDVRPYLRRVLRGRRVPPERIDEVAEHYFHFGGVSPLNQHNRALLAALERQCRGHGITLPWYWGNRNWHPLLADTLRRMRDDGVRRALVLVTSATSSYSGCRQYLEDLAEARAAVGPGAPVLEKIRCFYDHPGVVAAQGERLRAALDDLPAERREAACLVFTAHSLPTAMADGCDYVAQLRRTVAWLCAAVGRPAGRLAFQSRSGPPHEPWLEPDILDLLRELADRGVRDVVLAPIGFLSDHLEVLYDLDVEARALADRLGLRLVRARTVGTSPTFVRALRELIQERLDPAAPRRSRAPEGPLPDRCPADCCPRRARATEVGA